MIKTNMERVRKDAFSSNAYAMHDKDFIKHQEDLAKIKEITIIDMKSNM
jgi:hypothetical protein